MNAQTLSTHMRIPSDTKRLRSRGKHETNFSFVVSIRGNTSLFGSISLPISPSPSMGNEHPPQPPCGTPEPHTSQTPGASCTESSVPTLQSIYPNYGLVPSTCTISQSHVCICNFPGSLCRNGARGQWATQFGHRLPAIGRTLSARRWFPHERVAVSSSG